MDHSVKEAQQICNTSRKAIRYYEQIGLLEIKRFNKRMFLNEDNLNRLKIICYLRSLGIETRIIQDMLKLTNEERVILAFDEAYQKLLKARKIKQKQLESIEVIMENLEHKDIDDYDWNALLKLKENTKIIDTIIRRQHTTGSFYRMEEVAFTKKEYLLFKIFVYSSVTFTAILLVCMILQEVYEGSV